MSILKTGRLFLRNLAFSCTESDLQELFSSYGAISQVSFYLSIWEQGDGEEYFYDDKLS